MKFKKQQSGFTLIELVIVIVILGILAATAAPKFINLQADAHVGTLNAIKASMESAKALVHSKSLIAGNNQAEHDDNPAPTVDVNGTATTLHLGYPRANATDWAALLDVDTSANGDFSVATDGTVGSGAVIYYYPKGYADPSANSDPGTCYVSYTETQNATPPVVAVSTSC